MDFKKAGSVYFPRSKCRQCQLLRDNSVCFGSYPYSLGYRSRNHFPRSFQNRFPGPAIFWISGQYPLSCFWLLSTGDLISRPFDKSFWLPCNLSSSRNKSAPGWGSYRQWKVPPWSPVWIFFLPRYIFFWAARESASLARAVVYPGLSCNAFR